MPKRVTPKDFKFYKEAISRYYEQGKNQKIIHGLLGIAPTTIRTIGLSKNYIHYRELVKERYQTKSIRKLNHTAVKTSQAIIENRPKQMEMVKSDLASRIKRPRRRLTTTEVERVVAAEADKFREYLEGEFTTHLLDRFTQECVNIVSTEIDRRLDDEELAGEEPAEKRFFWQKQR